MYGVYYRVEGRIPVGRPRKTWLESVEADMAELEIDKKEGHFYFRTCRRDNDRHYILICRIIFLFYYFLVIGHCNTIIK